MSSVRMWWGCPRPARFTSHASTFCLKAAELEPSRSPQPYRDDVSIVVGPLTTQNSEAAGHGCVSQSSSGRQFSERQSLAERWEDWIQRSGLCQNSLLKLHGDICFLWFPPLKQPPGQRCDCMSHRPHSAFTHQEM